LERYELTGDDLFPEGITFDTEREAFVVGSLEHARLTWVDKAGVETVRLEPTLDKAWAISGVKYDSASDTVWACANTKRTEPEPAAEIWQVGAEDRSLTRFDLAKTGVEGAKCNDVVLAPGAVYISDAQSPYVYRIAAGSQAEVFATHPDFNAPIVGMNGMEVTGDWLLAARFRPSAIFRIALHDGTDIHEVALSGDPFEGQGSFTGADGLIFRDETLYVTMDDRMLLLDSADDWSSATVRHIDMPTGLSTATIADDAVYAIKSEVMKHVVGTPADLPFAITRVPEP